MHFQDNTSVEGNMKAGLYWRPPGANVENVHKSPPTQGKYRLQNTEYRSLAS